MPGIVDEIVPGSGGTGDTLPAEREQASFETDAMMLVLDGSLKYKIKRQVRTKRRQIGLEKLGQRQECMGQLASFGPT
jgi:hypothetical protein